MRIQFLQRHSMVSWIIATIVVGSLGTTFWIRPSIAAFGQAREKLHETQQESQTAAERLVQIDEIGAQLSAIAPEDIAKINNFFVASPELGSILAVLQQKAKETDWFLISLDIGKVEQRSDHAQGPLGDIAIVAQLKGGGYEQLKALLTAITMSIPVFDVTSLSFDPKSASLSISMKAHRVEVQSMRAVQQPIDQAFFNDPRFKLLHAPVALPTVTPIGAHNPFREFPGVSASEGSGTSIDGAR